MAQLNPLLIPTVLEVAFSYLDAKSVGKCRKICSQWERVATPIFRRKVERFQLDFSYDEEMNGPSYSHKKDAGKSRLPAYLAYLRAGGHPYPNVHFWDISIKQKVVQEFLDEFGATIRNFGLLDCLYNDPLSCLDYRSLFLRQAPNLESFTILCPSPTEVGPLGFLTNQEREEALNQSAPVSPTVSTKLRKIKMQSRPGIQFMKDLYQISPLLDNVTISIIHGGNIGYLGSFIEAQRLQNLRRLHLTDCDNEGIKLLREHFSRNRQALENVKRGKTGKNPKSPPIRALEKLHISYLRCTRPSEDLTLFLEEVAGSLKTLEIGTIFNSTYSREETFRVEFPSGGMPKLKELTLGLAMLTECNGEVGFSPVNLPLQFPLLERLLIGGTCSAAPIAPLFTTPIEGGRGRSHEGIRVLELPNHTPLETLRQVGVVLPNVRELRARVTVASQPQEALLREFWTLWPRLERLKLFIKIEDYEEEGGLSHMEIFTKLTTGLSSGQLREVKNQLNSDIKWPQHPSVSGLKNLIALVMELDQPFEAEERVQMMDILSNQCLGGMSSLRFLYISPGHRMDLEHDPIYVQNMPRIVEGLGKRLNLLWNNYNFKLNSYQINNYY